MDGRCSLQFLWPSMYLFSVLIITMTLIFYFTARRMTYLIANASWGAKNTFTKKVPPQLLEIITLPVGVTKFWLPYPTQPFG